jgi:hypothetical protein
MPHAVTYDAGGDGDEPVEGDEIFTFRVAPADDAPQEESTEGSSDNFESPASDAEGARPYEAAAQPVRGKWLGDGLQLSSKAAPRLLRLADCNGVIRPPVSRQLNDAVQLSAYRHDDLALAAIATLGGPETRAKVDAMAQSYGLGVDRSTMDVFTTASEAYIYLTEHAEPRCPDGRLTRDRDERDREDRETAGARAGGQNPN